jgi:2-haloalkanoic acid dehalogenase type II
MCPVRAVTLDAYGTVFDFEGDLRTRAVTEILEHAGLAGLCPVEFAEAWGRNFHLLYDGYGRPGWDQGAGFRSLADLTAEALAETYREHGHQRDPWPGTEIWIGWLSRAKPFPEIPEMLEQLAAAYPVAVVSDIDDRIIGPALEGLDGRFRFVLTSEAGRAYKHDPDGRLFRSALERLGRPAAEVAHVGDSPADIVGARLAGMRAVWVNRYGRELPEICPRPDLEMADLSGLVGALESLR